MESPHMYDAVLPGSEELKSNGINNRPSPPRDLADLTNTEISIDLQSFISDGSQTGSLEDSVILFSDILGDQAGKSPQSTRLLQGSNNRLQHNLAGYSMPHQQPHLVNNRYASEAGCVVKQEPLEELDFQNCHHAQVGSYGNVSYPYAPSQFASTTSSLQHRVSPPHIVNTATGSPLLPNYGSSAGLIGGGGPNNNVSLKSPHHHLSKQHHKSKKNVDKCSDEYRKRRERNNIAVRKSREKAKQRSKDTERRVDDLIRENQDLKKRVELLSKELTVLKSLLRNVGVPPENVDSEIAKHLHHLEGLQM